MTDDEKNKLILKIYKEFKDRDITVGEGINLCLSIIATIWVNEGGLSLDLIDELSEGVKITLRDHLTSKYNQEHLGSQDRSFTNYII